MARKIKSIVGITHTGRGKPSKIMLWLDQGTDVRWARLSANWKSKTKPGSLSSGPGSGRVLRRVDRRPHEGIKAREFTTQIALRREKPFTANVAEATRRAAKKLWK